MPVDHVHTAVIPAVAMRDIASEVEVVVAANGREAFAFSFNIGPTKTVYDADDMLRLLSDLLAQSRRSRSQGGGVSAAVQGRDPGRPGT